MSDAVHRNGHDHGHAGHDHDHGHGPAGEHSHEHGSGLLAQIQHVVRSHSHDAGGKVDAALEASAEGIRALWISLAVLGAAREIYRRLMDAVDPALVDQVEQTLRATPGVLGVGHVRVRWIGHQLYAECEIVVDGNATAVQAHEVAVAAEHDLLHALPRLKAALVHADPQAGPGRDLHAVLASHR